MTTAETAVDNPRRVKTEPFRGSFVYILTPKITKEIKNGVETVTKRYEMTVLAPPGSDIKRYNDALFAAMVDKCGADKKSWPRLKRKPADVISDFEAYNNEGKKPLPGDWKGWTMIRTASPGDKPPGIVGPVKGPDGKFPVITDAREIYSGRWFRATLEAFAYLRPDGNGVSFGIVNVQLLKHDTPFAAGASRPEQDFDDAPDDWQGSEGVVPAGANAAAAAADDDWN